MSKKKLGDLMLERGLITSEQLTSSLEEQKSTGARLGQILIGKGLISEEQLLEMVSERLSIPKLSLSQMVIDPQVIHRVPVDVARRYTLVPVFEIGKTLTLAMADPLNFIAIDEIKYLTRMTIKRAIATESEIKSAIDDYYSVGDSLHHIIGDPVEPALDLTDIDASDENESDSAVVKLVNLLISKAVRENASDIHIEPEEDKLRIRYRVHGIMREEASPPKTMQNELVSRIKIASNLDVSEKRLPQDGRLMMQVDGANIDLRISTLPTIHGEKVVIRVLDRRNLLMKFEQLGFNKTIETAWKNVIHQPEGLILISGPTSSGKTSTLYATLQEVNSIEKNIITVEDPVEYSLPLIIQIQINEKAGLTFPSTLRAMLRQNPDIIMLGEIRDPETARMAVRSSLTGHLVLSTIHTNDAPSSISRLMDMGIESYLVAAGLKGVLAQRLVRVNCPDCLVQYKPTEQILVRAGLKDLSDVINFRRGEGCPRCKNTGFKGLVGIYEYVEVTPIISDLIMRNGTISQIRETAQRGGYIPLFEMGLEKIQEGTICLEELLKQTSNIEDTQDQSYFGAMSHAHA